MVSSPNSRVFKTDGEEEKERSIGSYRSSLRQSGSMLVIDLCGTKYNSPYRELSLELPVTCVDGDRDFLIGC